MASWCGQYNLVLATHWCWGLRLLWTVLHWQQNFNCAISTCQKWRSTVTVVDVFARFHCHYKDQQEFQFGKEGYDTTSNSRLSNALDFAASHITRWPETTCGDTGGVNLGHASRHLSYAEGGQNSTTSAPVPGWTNDLRPHLKLIKFDRNIVFGAWARTHDYILNGEHLFYAVSQQSTRSKTWSVDVSSITWLCPQVSYGVHIPLDADTSMTSRRTYVS